MVTSKGTLVLRALSRKKFKMIAQELLLRDPVYAVLIKEKLYLEEIAAYPDGLNAEEAARLAHLTRRTAEWADWFGIETFVEPVMTHPDQLEALSSELEVDDWNQLDEMLSALTNPMPPSELNDQIGAICIKYGVPMAEGITADNITVQQTAVLDEAMAEESERATVMWEEMGKRQ